MTILPQTARDCAILIPTLNRPEILGETLRHLKGMGLDTLPLWLGDDCSDDPDMVRRVADAHWPDAHIIRQPVRRGQAHGRNALLRACERPWAILLDDDQYFLRVGNLFDYVSGQVGGDDLAVLSFQCRDKTDGRLDVPEGSPAGPVATYMGGAVMFKVEPVLAAGGYREYWGYGYEEPELAARLYARGYTVWYDPANMVEHNHVMGLKAARDETQYDYLYARNAILMSTLNMPLWFGLPVGLARSVKRSLLFKRNARAKLRGTLAGMAMTFRYWRDRRPMSFRQAQAWLRFSRGPLGAAP
jgi:glycosyltransferase involved in cell wall biosynthesis